MSLISVFFRKPAPTQILRSIGGQVVPLIIDVTEKEGFTAPAVPTEHPVEDGSDVTDHVVLKPKTITLSGLITETPFEGLEGLIHAAGATAASAVGSSLGSFAGSVGGVAGAIGGASLAGTIFGSTDRVLSAVVTEFVKLRDAKSPVDIQTGLQLYKSFILSNFSASRDKTTGRAVHVDLEFKELILVESQTTQVAIPKVKGGIAGKDLGRQSKGSLSDDENAQGSSLLKKIFGQG